MENTFKVTGLSFKSTPIEVREKLALDEVQAKELITILMALQFMSRNHCAGMRMRSIATPLKGLISSIMEMLFY